METNEPVKIDKKIVGFKVVTQEGTEKIPDEQGVTYLDATDRLIEELEESALIASATTLLDTIEAKEIKMVTRNKVLKRPRKLTSETYRLKPPHYEHAIYIHISDIIYEGKKYPFEIFFNCKNPENIMWVSTITLLLSETFREAITGNNNLTKVINNLKDVCDASGGYFASIGEKKKHVGSIVAEIGYILEAHVKECNAWNYSQSNHERPATEDEKKTTFQDTTQFKEFMESKKEVTFFDYCQEVIANPCPDCGSQLTKQAGCDICLSCGYSKCS